jgi:hypothetical protein
VLETKKMVQVYEAEGKKYLFVDNWEKHQKVHNPNKPRYPRPSNDSKPLAADSTETLGRTSEILGTGSGGQGVRGSVTTPLPPSQGEVDESKFNEFIQAYPKPGNLKAVRAAWNKATTTGLAEPDQLITAAKQLAKQWQQAGTEIRYAPAPTNFITEGAWQKYTPKPQNNTISDAWIQDNLTLKLPHGTDPWEARRTLINLTKTGTPKEQAVKTILNQTRKENQ